MTTEDVALIADIGGTNMRFALVENGHIRDAKSYPWPEKPSLSGPALEYLREHKVQPRHAAFASANAQPGFETIRMVNVGDHNDLYTFNVSEVRQMLGLESLHMLNDFAAIALAMPVMQDEHLIRIGGGKPVAERPIGIIGPGTGLGCSSLVWANGRYMVVSGEGGHVTIGGTDKRECALIEWLHNKFPHVSAERVLSGPGLVNLHEAIRAVDKLPAIERSPADILRLALAGEDKSCREALDVFCSLLGSVAGNLALMLAASGGIYIAGGIPPRMSGFIAASSFRRKFSAKGRYHEFLEAIPTSIVTHPSPGLLGASIALQHVNTDGNRR